MEAFSDNNKKDILVVNGGSSSIKYSRYSFSLDTLRSHGQIERIGSSSARLVHNESDGQAVRELSIKEMAEAFPYLRDVLAGSGSRSSSKHYDIGLVVHRVVHGGDKFIEATLLSDTIINQLENLNPLAPLHNPLNLQGIRSMQTLFPSAAHVAVFDTAFHHTLPDYAYLYGLPFELYEKHRVRRYGFHGTSHRYVVREAARHVQRPLTDLRIISCHLGNGASICAVDCGKSVDTSMGFTPAEGLIMGTRCGDLDSGAYAFLERELAMSGDRIETLLNKESGVLGISGVSSDMREVLKASDGGHARAKLAIDAYCYRIKKYIGAYIAAIGGVDILVFTGGVGQGRAEIRNRALSNLQCFGIEIDAGKNIEAKGFDQTCDISSDKSRVTVLVVPTDEQRMMAEEALSVLKS